MNNLNWFLRVLVITVFTSAFNLSFSQTMYFCEGVDDDGEPINESSVFTIPEGGGYLYVLIQMPYEIGCKKVNLDIFRNGDFDNTISIDTEKNWVWFWKKITFYKAGEFLIEAYDCYDDLITSGSVEIEMD